MIANKMKASRLLALLIVVLIISCIALVALNNGNCDKANAESSLIETVASGENDYSVYTDKVLPDKIDKDNLKNYVPIDKFNTNGTTVYNGRNYGFIIYSNSGTNHVLLFKEIYTPHEDGDGYETTLKVIYENSFFRGIGNSLIYAKSPYHFALADIKFDNMIMDSDSDNNILYKDYNSNLDTGAYYTQVRYENQFSYYDGRLAGDTFLAVVSAAADVYGFVADIFNLKGGKFADAISGACTMVSDGLLIYDISQTDNYWVEHSTFDTDIDFPLTRQGQIEKYGSLKKDVRIDVQADKNEYLSGDNGGGFARAIYRIMNENRKDYYINNRISFDICRYNGAERHKVDDAYIESVYSVTGTKCDGYGGISELNETFNYYNYQRITPMITSNVFTFKPKEIGKYNIIVPQGYYLSVNGTPIVDNVVDVGEDGCIIGLVKSSDANIGNMLYSRLLPQDFYNGEIAFTNLTIQKNQYLNLNGLTKVDDVVYCIERVNAANNDIYMLDAGTLIDDVDLYITDSNLNVLSKATKKEGKLYVNYPMKANSVYGVVCVNRTGSSLDLTVKKESGMTIENRPYSDVEGLYYSFNPKYTQFYNAVRATLYDENMNLVSDIGDNAFLQAGYNYYLLHRGTGNISIELSEQTLHILNSINETLESQNSYNEMFNFTPVVTARYTFADGTYDVYDGNNVIAQNVSQCILRKDTRYLIIKRQFGGYTKIYLDGDELNEGTNNVDSTQPYEVYKLNIAQKSRLDIIIDNAGAITVYDAALNKIEYDHGYLFEAGTYYVIVENSGAYNITIEKYIQQVNLTFYVDGEVYDDATGEKYYYGENAALPVPVKERYDFNGWKHNGKLVTNSQGVTYSELLEDEMTLVADWTLRGIVMEICLSNGASKWWDGSDITSQNPGEVYIEGQVIDLLVNMKSDFVKTSDGKKQGYFLQTFEYQKTGAVLGVDYYEFTPIWQQERYYIEFIAPYPQTYKTSRAIEYGETISSSVFPSQAFQLDRNQQLYYLIGWKLSDSSGAIRFVQGGALTDLTPGYGSEFNYDSDGDNVFDSTLIRMSAAVEYVDYTVRINSVSHHVPLDGYNVGTLGSYGYTESKYYGHNVYFTTPKADRNFSFGSVINVSDLTSYWTSGSRAVTVDLSLVDSEITVGLSYSHSGSGNQDTYRGSDGNVNIKDMYLRSYCFVNWTLDGNVITVLNYSNLGIRQYYSNVKGVTLSKTITANFTDRVNIRPTSGVTYTINNAATYIDLSRFTLMVGMTFNIYASAKEVTFVNGKCSDTRIIIYKRSEKLVLNFNNVNMQAKSNNSVIDAGNCSDLEIYSYNHVTLSAGEVNKEVSNAAIVCQNLSLMGQNININGGNQMGGYGIYGNAIHVSYATAGIKCTDADKKLHVDASKVVVHGGNGKTPILDIVAKDGTEVGEDGEVGCFGLNGSDGAVAIYFNGYVNVMLGSQLECFGGVGGNGCDGKKGGNGGPGSGVAIKSPGNGGDGGCGGDGGDGAKAIVCKSFTGNTSGLKDGKGGAGGIGGKGGAPGDPVTTIIGTKRGERGEDGDPGTPGQTGESELA